MNSVGPSNRPVNYEPAEKIPDKGLIGRAATSLVVDTIPIIKQCEIFASLKPDLTGTTPFQEAMTLAGCSGMVNAGFNIADSISDATLANTELSKAVHGLDATRNILDISLGATKAITAGFSLAAVNTTTSVVTNGLSTLKSIGGPIAIGFFSLLAIPKCIVANRSIFVKDVLKKSGVKGLEKLFKDEPAALEVALPELFKKLKSGDEITAKMVDAALKDLNKAIIINIASAAIGILAIVLGVLGAIFTSGIAPLAILITSFVISVIVGGFDIIALIDKLKKSIKLTTKDAVLQTITMVIAVAAIVISAAFVPCGAIMAAGVASGVFLAAIPAASMIAMKAKEVKEAKLAYERRKEFEKRLYPSRKKKKINY